MISCSKCNKTLTENRNYCPFCGARQIPRSELSDEDYFSDIEPGKGSKSFEFRETPRNSGMNPGCLVFIIGSVLFMIIIAKATSGRSYFYVMNLAGEFIGFYLILIVISGIVFFINKKNT